MPEYDAVVVGSGPNGLAAAITLAQAGRSVLVVEGADAIGGGTRTEELTLPGFRHDVCSAVHPLAIGSPFLRSLPLAEHGLEWAQPRYPLAHAVDRDNAVIVHKDIAETAAGLGADGPRYRRALGRLDRMWPDIENHLLGPVVRIPEHPLALARFGMSALPPASASWNWRWIHWWEKETRALFAGCAAHAFLPLSRPLTSSFGWLMLITAHRFGWPVAVGGSAAITNAMASYLRSLGGEIRTGWMVESLDELPASTATLLDLTPTGFARIAGKRLPASYLRKVGKYRYGPAAFKLDLAIDGPIPWANPSLAGAGTVHIGGSAEEIASAEKVTWNGDLAERPFILLGQQSVADPSRAPAGRHTVWAYAHVPNNSSIDLSEHIVDRVEELAPGFRDRILASHSLGPRDWPARNPNFVGGDIAGGAHSLMQFVTRPFPQWNPYRTPLDGVFLCSSSTPPGAGTHGMCGHHAALTALG